MQPRPPAPAGLSAEAREWLTNPPIEAGVAMPERLDDLAGWQHYVEARDRHLLDVMFSALPDDLPIDRTDTEVDGVRTYVLVPHDVADSPDTPIHLEIHGGGLLLCGGELCARMGFGGALGRRAITWSVDYRMPPSHPHPAALDDCLTVYRRILRERDPRSVTVGGASAGGNLAAALMLRAKDEGLPMPAALVLGTPEVDLTESGDTFATNLGIDSLGPLMPANLLYANGADLTHPYLSPLFGDVAGFPPTILTTGTRDLYLSNTVRFHRALRAAGVEAELHVGEAMPHAGFGGRAPEDRALAAEVRHFVERHLRSGG